jgi:uncharacterized C2H2 Zn-finger protein
MIKWSDVRTRGGSVFDSCPYIDDVIDYLKLNNAPDRIIENMEYIRTIAKELRSDFNKGEDKIYELDRKIDDLEEKLSNLEN